MITGFSNVEVTGELHKESFSEYWGQNTVIVEETKEEELGKAITVNNIKTKLQRSEICCICADFCLNDKSDLEWDLLGG